VTRAGRFAISVAVGALLTFVAVADTVHVHGVVQAFDGSTLTIKSDSGKAALIGISPQTRIVRSRSISLKELKSGDRVATLSMRDAKGNLHVLSVRVLSTSPISTDDGQYAFDSSLSRIVTNGTITAIAPAGNALSLSFHGASGDGTTPCSGHAPPGGEACTGSADLLIARGVPIIEVTNGDTNLLLPGAIVSVSASSAAANLSTASGVSVEREGKPAQ
jgi:hypothetical protein